MGQLTPCYVCDIDGTIADLSHRLHFIDGTDGKQDWDKFFDECDNDSPLHNVIDVVRRLQNTSMNIVFCTGRPERVRRKTIQWLTDWGLDVDRLFMRKDGDHRPDTITKTELMEQLKSLGYEVFGVFEDRPSVCRVWRKMGLTVFQMTDKEF